MLSVKLVQLIEDHWDGITTAILHQIKTDARLSTIRELPDTEIRDVGRMLLRNLGHYLTASKAELRILEEQFEGLGRIRFAERIPLHEAVRALQIVKKKVIEFSRDHEFGNSAASIYAEEELEHRLNEFFDDLIYFEVRGYESALTQTGAFQARV